MSADKQHNSGATYKDAGVDIDAGEALVEAIKPLAKSTRRPGADAALGGFGGIFDLKAAGFKDPLLVAANDGVGTKLRVALLSGQHDTVGIDLVAMCVNDLVVQGAEPLFFLDYYATGKLDVETARDVVKGIAEGCLQSGCALIGGETAEMPGMYDGDDYDLAGFAVGAVERGDLLRNDQIEPGDVILGLASSGLHSNGFSLVRQLVENSGVSYSDQCPFEDGVTLGQALLTPTRIYVKSVLAAVREGYVIGLAHITGGGFLENIPRCLPDNCAATVDAGAWPLPPVFGWLRDQGNMQAAELVRTFNCGIGMVVIVSARNVDAATALFEAEGETVYRIGDIVPHMGKPVTIMTAAPNAWGHGHGWSATTVAR